MNKKSIGIIFLIHFLSIQALNEPFTLENKGFLCYMNATLQVLFACKPLNEKILEKRKNKRSVSQEPKSIIENNYAVFLEKKDKHTVSPGVVLGQCKLEYGKQQDAQEFLIGFINGLSEEARSIFNFETIAYATCSNNVIEAMPVEEHTLLKIPIPESSSSSPMIPFNDIIASFFKPESFLEMKEDLRPRCPVSDAFRVNSTRNEFKKLPHILIVSIGRYLFDRKQNKIIKNKTAIQAPLNNIMLAAQDGSSKEYSLCGCVIHEGATAASGHYVSVVRYDNQWYYCDDIRQNSAIDKDTAVKIMQGEKNDYSSTGQGYLYFFQEIVQEKLVSTHFSDMLTDFQKELYGLHAKLLVAHL